jgi:hypothetical protein
MIPLDNKNALIEIMKMSFVGGFFWRRCAKQSLLKIRGFIVKRIFVTSIIA